MEAAAMISEAMELMGQSDEKNATHAAWVATYVDGFCSQYHWRLDDVLDTPLLVSAALGGAIGQRAAMGAGGDKKPTFSRHSDRVRKEFLSKSNKVDAALMREDKFDG